MLLCLNQHKAAMANDLKPSCVEGLPHLAWLVQAFGSNPIYSHV